MPSYRDERAALRLGEHAVGSPDESWTNDEIREWLDSRGVEYTTRDTKDELLAKVP